jgi:hypothetical protein
MMPATVSFHAFAHKLIIWTLFARTVAGIQSSDTPGGQGLQLWEARQLEARRQEARRLEARQLEARRSSEAPSASRLASWLHGLSVDQPVRDWATADGCTDTDVSGSYNELTVRLQLSLASLPGSRAVWATSARQSPGALRVNVLPGAPGFFRVEFAVSGLSSCCLFPDAIPLKLDTVMDITITYSSPRQQATLYVDGAIMETMTTGTHLTVQPATGQTGCYDGDQILQGSITNLEFVEGVVDPTLAQDVSIPAI